jgi:hypothetical protein
MLRIWPIGTSNRGSLRCFLLRESHEHWTILNQGLLNANIPRLVGPEINIVDKSWDITEFTVSRTQKEIHTECPYPNNSGTRFLETTTSPRDDCDERYRDPYPSIVARSYKEDFTHNLWKGAGRSQFRIL